MTDTMISAVNTVAVIGAAGLACGFCIEIGRAFAYLALRRGREIPLRWRFGTEEETGREYRFLEDHFGRIHVVEEIPRRLDGGQS